MTWTTNFDDILRANGIAPRAQAPAAAPVAAAAIDPAAHRAALYAAFQQLPDFEQHVGTMTTLGLRDRAAMEYMERMLATPKDQDQARAVETAQRTAAQMMGAGASDKQILQAVGNLPGVNFETRAAATAAAEHVLETDKFNLFSTRNADTGVNTPVAEVATLETASLNPQLQNVLTGNLAKRHDLEEALRRQYQNHRVPPYPAGTFASVSTVTAAPVTESLADALDFVRDSGPGYTPNVRGNNGPGRSGGNSLG